MSKELSSTKGTNRYAVDVTSGNSPGESRFAFAGHITTLDIADGKKDVWEGNGSRTRLTADTQLYISSSDVNDANTVVIQGTNAAYEDVVALVTLDGQNQVALSAEMMNAFVLTSLGTPSIIGALYIAELDGTISGGVPQDDTKVQLVSPEATGGGLIAIRSVITGHTAYITTLTTFVKKGKAIRIYLGFESPTQGRILTAPYEVYQNGVQQTFFPSFSVPEGNDLIFLAETDDDGAAVTVLVEGVLKANI